MARTVRRRPDPEQQHHSRRWLILYGVAAVVALVVLAAILFYVRLTGGPALPREVRQRIRQTQHQARQPSSQPAPTAPTATPGAGTSAAAPATPGVPTGTPAFPQQIQQVQQAAQVGDTAPRTLYLTDADLTAQIAGEITKHQEVKEAHAYFEDGKAYLTARVDAKGHELNLTMVLAPTVSNGAVRFDVQQVFVGQVAAPPAIAQKVQEEIGKRGAWFAPEKTGLYVERIEMKSGVAVLTGRPVRRQ